jgi:hypothetical protein
LNSPIVAILYSLSGFLMKFSDDEYDEKSNKLLAVILGIFCGITIAYLASNNIDAAYIFIGILLGNALSLKIDGIHHLATLIVFLFLFMFWGIISQGSILANFSIITLTICTVSAFIDEIGNDNLKLYAKSRFLKFFFDYRFAMKIAILVLAILGFYQSFTGFTIPLVDFLNFESFIFFILFEISYELANYIFDRYFL